MKLPAPFLLLVASFAPLGVRATVTVDANGWTVVTPSADSRVVYVSSSSGNDNNDGLSTATAKATIGAGSALCRDGYPDHLLLKRGDTFSSSGLGAWKNGRNANEPAMISYYGTSGARPVIKITNTFIDHNGAVRNYQVFRGIDVYKSNSDPASGDYTGASGSQGMRLVGGGTNIIIEDCRFRFIEFTLQEYGGGTYNNVQLRRNIHLDSWMANSFNDAGAKIQGLYISGTTNYTLEENFFDHNGWSEVVANAGANEFNHNIYIQYSNGEGGLMRGNIIARGAAHGMQARSGGLIDRNLFVLNAVAFNMGGYHYPTDPDVQNWPNAALDNVVLNGRLMSTVNSNPPRTTAVWGVWEDVFVTGALIDGNIVANRIDSGSNVSYNGKSNMDFGSNISYNWDPNQDTTNGSWPHPGDDLGDYNALIGGTNSTTAYLTTLRNRNVGEMPWNLTAYAAINYIRAGFLQPAISGVYQYPGTGTPVVTIAATDASAGEPSNNGLFTVTASPAPPTPITVNLIRSGTATNGVDYTSIATTVTIGTSGSATIPVTVINDSTVESSETVILTVTTGTGYVVGGANSATVTITDDDGSNVVATAGGGFVNTALSSSQTGSFTVTYNATPSVSGVDSVTGLSPLAAAAYTDMAAIVRFNPTGTIDARNGGVYSAATSIPYSGGLTYAVRMVVNVATHTYSVYVTPPGGSELTIGSNYAFRTEQNTVASLNDRTVQVLTPTGATMTIGSFVLTGGNVLSFPTFEPNQATVLQDMPTTYTLGSGALNIWEGRVGAVSSQNTTYSTEGSNHYVAVGGSANGNGCFQVVAWPGAGTKPMSFSYRGSLGLVKIYGGNAGNTIDKFSASNTLTLIQQFNPATAASWTTVNQNITLTGSYPYLVVQIRGGDFDNVSFSP